MDSIFYTSLNPQDSIINWICKKSLDKAQKTLVLCSSLRLKEHMLEEAFRQDVSIPIQTLDAFAKGFPLDSPAPNEGIEKWILKKVIHTKRNLFPKTLLSCDSFIDLSYQLWRSCQAINGAMTALPDTYKSLFHAYHTALKESPYQAPFFQRQDTANHIQKFGHDELHNRTVIWVGFFTLTAPQEYLFSAISAHAYETHVLGFESRFFLGKNNPLIKKILANNPTITIDFAKPQQKDPPTPLCIDSASPKHEWDILIQNIAHLNIKKNVPLESISIILPNQHQARHLAEYKLQKYHIPYRISVKDPLSETQAGCFFQQFIRLLQQRWKRPLLCSFLRTPFVQAYWRKKRALKNEPESLWPDFIDRVAKSLGVSKEPEIWIAKWASEINYHLNKTKDPDGTNEQHIKHLNYQHTFITNLYEQEKKILKSTSINMFAQSLQALVTTYSMEDQLRCYAPNPTEALEALVHIQTLLRNLETMYPKLEAGQFSWRRACEAFLLLLNNTTLSVATKKRGRGVMVLGKKEAFMLQSEYMFMPHCTQGNWPGNVKQTPLLTPQESNAIGLPTESEQNQETLFLFQSLTKQSKVTQISYPKEEQGTPCLESPFLVGIPKSPHANNPTALLSCEEEHLAYLGKNIHQHQKESQTNATILHFHTSWPYKSHPPTLKNHHINAYFKAQNKDINTPYFGKIPPLLSPKKSFSASQFESYQNCPYRYFLQTICQLPSPPSDEDISPQRWGNFIHDIFFKAKANPRAFSKAIESSLTHYRTPSFEWDIQKSVCTGEDQHEGLFPQFDTMISTADYTLNPVAFEHPFGLKEKPPLTLRLGDDTLDVRGQIDLICTDETGQNLVIADYKTGGKLPTKISLDRLESLQLAIYTLAAQEAFPGKPVIAGLIYHVKTPVSTAILLCDAEAKKATFNLKRKAPQLLDAVYLSRVIERLFVLKNHINSGHFSPGDGSEHPFQVSAKLEKDRSKTCSYCDYKRVCRHPKRFS